MVKKQGKIIIADISIQGCTKNKIINALVGIPALACPRPPRVNDPPRIYVQGSSFGPVSHNGGSP